MGTRPYPSLFARADGTTAVVSYESPWYPCLMLIGIYLAKHHYQVMPKNTMMLILLLLVAPVLRTIAFVDSYLMVA